jgi:hypothetical protein
MPDHSYGLTPDRRLSRPRDVIEAEQKRHDDALARGLIAVFSVLAVGGGLAGYIGLGPLFRGQTTLQAVLIFLVFVAPLIAAFTVMVRVPPPPFESLGDARRDMDKKLGAWRAGLMSQIFIFTMLGAEMVWLWPRSVRAPRFALFAIASSVPLLCIVLLVVISLYVRPGWLNTDLRKFLDDEVTRSFRARAQRLGYLLALFILMGFCVLARINPLAAARFMPLGLAVGSALPLLYFVYLDWQASRGG